MDEFKTTRFFRGTDMMNHLIQSVCQEAPSMPREELESGYVNMTGLYGDMWRKNIKLEREVRKLEETIKKRDGVIKSLNNIILSKKENWSRLSDTGMRYFQVRNGSEYQILIQDKTDNSKPSVPHRIQDDNGGALHPIYAGHSWSLDKCVGVINLEEKENIYTDDDDEFVEVEPHFKKIIPKSEGYPDGKMMSGKNKIQVEILIPPSHPFEKLNRLVGCEDIKRRLEEFKSLAEYNKACRSQSREFPVMEIFLHSIFFGNPGTGKTTVCRLYGALLKEAGLLSKGHVVVADRNIFCGDCFGNTEEMIPQLLEMSKGGILMFDEAYLLEGVHREDPNKMVLPLMLSALADERNKDFAVVLCGYKDKLDKMIEQNPGLYSRFINRFEFKDYSLDELTEIGVRYLKTFGHSFSPDGLSCFREELKAAMSGSRDETWANARSVKSMIEHTYVQRAMRYRKDATLDRIITAEDVATIPLSHRRRIGF